MGAQGRRRLSGAGRGAPVSLTEDPTDATERQLQHCRRRDECPLDVGSGRCEGAGLNGRRVLVRPTASGNSRPSPISRLIESARSLPWLVCFQHRPVVFTNSYDDIGAFCRRYRVLRCPVGRVPVGLRSLAFPYA